MLCRLWDLSFPTRMETRPTTVKVSSPRNSLCIISFLKIKSLLKRLTDRGKVKIKRKIDVFKQNIDNTTNITFDNYETY